ncbi:hypothetical protein BST27_23055 [Mycobacterium intermedium]|uniref:Lipopolysaccharide assembly protein A domain-containing protein n=1 Tax=Mycobacterium intermedium TaxID=28445 RepID=A0A1E3SLF0_MYCIE|nr:lipopolysaccharide assembly protein LapA domain-containing protein [Mycobacterium intermedium]MCV6962537.1 DUF1049 domain-containing protein [Mycobacterium intermedium]ODR02473.1 hypothetical protein BHQ20_04270 [Mycobacterium intermedium]OPE52869.1 hypothetical protein BV508_01110 [Mycobacterium intermedium]ORA97189.1 hypothetical protein BST27_23055 [Mycobacterium intermedium]
MTSNTPGSPDQPAPAPEPRTAPPPAAPAVPKDSSAKFTRAGALWAALTAGFLILILLLIFVAQNPASQQFQFLGLHWSLPLGVAILLAAVVGGLLTVVVGTARILQLRRAARKNYGTALRQTGGNARRGPGRP